jgi:hypothetical protein
MATSPEGDEQLIGARVAGFLRANWDVPLAILVFYYVNVFHNEIRAANMATTFRALQVAYVCKLVYDVAAHFAKPLGLNQATARSGAAVREAVARATTAVAAVFAAAVQ